MAIALKSEHLQRYREIVRLLYKYGRRDALEKAGLEDPGAEEGQEPSAQAGASRVDPQSLPRVHAAPGDFLRRQEEKIAAEGNGKSRRSWQDEKDEEDGHALGRHLADDLEAMGPTFIKLGQFLSTRTDLLPAPYVEALSRLQDNVAPFPFTDVERIVTEELGVRISKAFAVFEDIPVAAASLGQVHRAELRDGRVGRGQGSAAGIRERIETDLEALEEIAELLDQPHRDRPAPSVRRACSSEFRKHLMQRAGLPPGGAQPHAARREPRVRPHRGAASGRRLRHLARAHDGVRARPKVTSLGPLVRIEFDGAPLAEELCKAYLQQILVDGFFHADPHPGNVFLTDDGRLALLDLGMVAQIGPRMQEKLLQLCSRSARGAATQPADRHLAIGRSGRGSSTTSSSAAIVEMVLPAPGLPDRATSRSGGCLFEAARIVERRRLPHAARADHAGQDAAQRRPGRRAARPRVRSQRRDPPQRGRAHAPAHAKSLSPASCSPACSRLKDFAEKLPRRAQPASSTRWPRTALRVKVDAINEGC